MVILYNYLIIWKQFILNIIYSYAHAFQVLISHINHRKKSQTNKQTNKQTKTSKKKHMGHVNVVLGSEKKFHCLITYSSGRDFSRRCIIFYNTFVKIYERPLSSFLYVCFIFSRNYPKLLRIDALHSRNNALPFLFYMFMQKG